MAILGASVPGFLHITWTGGGLIVRAGGSLALFVLTFVYTPNVLPIGGLGNHQPYANLEIIDVTPTRNAVDIKFKNSGNDSAFLKKVRFIQRFAYAGCCSCAYAFVNPTVYDYLLTYAVGESTSSSTVLMHSLNAPSSDVELTVTPASTKDARCKGVINENASSETDPIVAACKSHYEGYGGGFGNKEVETTGIKLSQVVPPRGVDRVELSFSTPGEKQLSWGHYIVFEGYAIFFYDDDEYVCSSDFGIVFSGEQ
jgi:hypothetical protein